MKEELVNHLMGLAVALILAFFAVISGIILSKQDKFEQGKRQLESKKESIFIIDEQRGGEKNGLFKMQG